MESRICPRGIKHSTFFAAFFALCVWHSALIAASAPYHLPPLSVSSIGSGYATLAEGNDASTIFWNPAGLALMNQMSAQLTLGLYDEQNHPTSWSLLFASNLSHAEGQFGLGIIRRYSENSSGEFKSFEVLNPLSFKGSRSTVAWGFTPKLAAENFGEKWVYGLKLDAGVSLKTERKSGMVLAFAMQNFAGSNLRAFRWDSWGGFRSGSEANTFTMYVQTRMDKPFNAKYMSENYRIGGLLKPEDRRKPEVRMGLIRDRGVVQYTAGLTYRSVTSSTRIEYAIIWNPNEKQSFAHFLSYGFHVIGGAPTRPSKMTW